MSVTHKHWNTRHTCIKEGYYVGGMRDTYHPVKMIVESTKETHLRTIKTPSSSSTPYIMNNYQINYQGFNSLPARNIPNDEKGNDGTRALISWTGMFTNKMSLPPVSKEKFNTHFITLAKLPSHN